MKSFFLTLAAITVLLSAAAHAVETASTPLEKSSSANAAKEPQTVVKVGRNNGRTSIFINDQPIPGIAILAPIRALDDKSPSSLDGSLKAGIKIIVVQMGPHWNGPGKIDAANTVRRLKLALEHAPDAWLIPRIHLDAPGWWLKDNPGECARNADSEGPENYPSVGSERWLKDSSELLAETVKTMEASPYANRIIGYSLLCSHGGEWIYTGAGAGRIGDYSEPAQRYFRAWLKKKYGDQKWIADAKIPTAEERGKSLPAMLRDPQRDARVIDFDMAFSDMTADNILAWTGAVKRASGGRKLAGVFYGYLLWGTGLVNSTATNGHLALRRLLDSPDLDFVTSFASYDVREPGSAAPILFPVESIQAAGKLVFDECDNRTYLVKDEPPIRFFMARDQREPANGPQLWAGAWNTWGMENAATTMSVLRRDFVTHLIRGSSFWWFDMTGGWYASKEIEDEFAKQVKIAEATAGLDMTSVSQVAGIVSAESPAYHSLMRMYDVDPQASLVDLQADMSTREMYKAGAPIDWWMPEDLARPDLKKYKALYFHNATTLSKPQLAALEALKRDDRTLIFVGYPGLAADGKLDAQAASNVAGIQLKLVHTRGVARFRIDDYNIPCMSEATAQMMLGTGVIVSPRLIVDDPKAQIIAHWPDGLPAAAMKQHDGWTSYYFPVPPNNAQLFRAIFKNAGCHIYTHNTCRDIVYANRSLLAIHTTHYGQDVRLPAPARITDLFTGTVLSEKSDTIHLGKSWHFTGGTSLFRIEYHDNAKPNGK